MNSAPFDNVDVRRAFYYAVNRKELTDTVLKNIAIPAGSILAPGYPGYNPDIAEEAVFDPQKAKDFMAKAGYPDGKGFPDVEIWYREEGGYNGAIIPPMLQYLQAQFKDILGINMAIKVMPGQGLDGRALERTRTICSWRPYEYDYLDPSNFFGIFYDGGRHDYHFADYDKLVEQADSISDWDKRLELYAEAEQVMIDQAMIVPLVHPITIAVISDKLSGDASTDERAGLFPARPAGQLLLHPHHEAVRHAKSSSGVRAGGPCRPGR